MSLAHLTETKVQQVIDLTDALYNANPSKELGLDSREDAAQIRAYASSPHRKALHEYLETLSADELAELIALTWHGRGDVDPDWSALVESARSQRPGVAYVMGKTVALTDYLKTGLEKLKA